jgi:hypothetical protein
MIKTNENQCAVDMMCRVMKVSRKWLHSKLGYVSPEAFEAKKVA